MVVYQCLLNHATTTYAMLAYFKLTQILDSELVSEGWMEGQRTEL